MRGRLSTLVLLVLALGASNAAPANAGVFRSHGLVVRYPRGWFVSTEPLNGISDPVQRLVLSSYRLGRFGLDANGDYRPPPGEVVAQLLEEVPPLENPGPWPRRPQSFRLPRLGRMEGFGGRRWAELRFVQHGRRFYLFIGVGRRAPTARVRSLLRALDTMKISTRRSRVR